MKRKNGVSVNGRLQVIGTQLCNECGEPIVLRGISSHGLQWFGNLVTRKSMEEIGAYGANIFRLAMYTAEDGYLNHPEQIKELVKKAVADASACDLYVIVDWHILADNNPMDHLEEAKTFFKEMSELYKDNPAVIYEICNEPNGDTSWEESIRPYAEEIIGVIRKADPKAVILVGSGTWSQDIHEAAKHPLTGDHIMYTCHFYSGTHGQWLRDRIDHVLEQKLPIFISEWGTSAADGNGGVFLKEAGEWLQFLDERRISWCNWSLTDKNETSALLKPDCAPDGVWKPEDLSESGKFVLETIRSHEEAQSTSVQKNPVVTVTMASGGTFSFELWPDMAPNACCSIIKLARQGAYDGMTIDRIVPGFVIQPRYSDEGRPDLDFVIDGEFEAAGWQKGAAFEPGVIGMAGDGETFASGSSFFVTLGGCERLTGHFTAAGKLIDGWDEIRRLEKTETRPVDIGIPGVTVNCPIVPEIMEHVTVETFGKDYPEPAGTRPVEL